MKNLILTVIILAFSYHFGWAQTSNQGPVQVGDQAPPLHIAKWLKGNPVQEFKEDQVYVVEFSGSWCPPCRKSIPHLTQLQKKYKDKIQIISVYFEYNDPKDTTDLNYIQEVRHLMKSLGDKMDFTIAVDVPQQTTKTTWGPFGLPRAVVVQSGKISWIGQPTVLDPVLEQVVSGTFSPEKAIANDEALNGEIKNAKLAKSNGDYQSALTIVDRLIREYPGSKTTLYYYKYRILAGDDDMEAYAWLQWLMDNKVEGLDWTHLIGEFDRRISAENRNYELELQILDYAMELETEKYKPSIMLSKARTYAKMGNYQKAVELCRQALTKYEKTQRRDGLYYEKIRKQYYNYLALYTYKLLADKDIDKANTWLEDELQSVYISSFLVEAVVEVVTTSPSLKNIRLAHELIDRVIREEEMTSLPHYRWSQKAAVYTAAGKYTFAHKWIDKAIQESSNSLYLARKASIYTASGELDKAIDLCQEAIKLEKSKVVAAKNDDINRNNYLKRVMQYEKQLAALKTRIENQ